MPDIQHFTQITCYNGRVVFLLLVPLTKIWIVLLKDKSWDWSKWKQICLCSAERTIFLGFYSLPLPLLNSSEAKPSTLNWTFEWLIGHRETQMINTGVIMTCVWFIDQGYQFWLERKTISCCWVHGPNGNPWACDKNIWKMALSMTFNLPCWWFFVFICSLWVLESQDMFFSHELCCVGDA